MKARWRLADIPKKPKPLGAADRQRWLILHVSTQGIELAGDQIDFLIE